METNVIKLLVAALVLLALCGACCAEAPLSLQGEWSVRTLLPGTSAIPPSHTVTVEGSTIRLSELQRGRIVQFAGYLGEQLHLSNSRVPERESSTCRLLPSLTNWSLTGFFDAEGDGVLLECNAGLLEPLNGNSLRSGGAPFFQRFSPPQPLLAKRINSPDAPCEQLPWKVEAVSLQLLGPKQLVMSAHLLEFVDQENVKPCMALFYLNHVEKHVEKDLRSYLGPVLMILIVVLMRTAPRYYLRKTGSIDADTFRSPKPPTLTPEKRSELLRKQREIIEQMKKEDGIAAK